MFGLSAAAIAAIAVGAAAIGAGVSAYSASEQADAQQKAANYQAQVDANNAKIAANNAKIAAWNRSDALQRGEIEAQKSMRDRAGFMSQQRAKLAASGQDMTQGSALDLLASSEFLGQEEVNTINNNAAREAWGYELEGMNYMNQGQAFQSESDFSRWKANSINPTKAGAMAGASSLLSSASSYAGSRAK